jgi:hypothetical protein
LTAFVPSLWLFHRELFSFLESNVNSASVSPFSSFCPYFILDFLYFLSPLFLLGRPVRLFLDAGQVSVESNSR